MTGYMEIAFLDVIQKYILQGLPFERCEKASYKNYYLYPLAVRAIYIVILEVEANLISQRKCQSCLTNNKYHRRLYVIY